MTITRTSYNRWPWGKFALCRAALRPPFLLLNQYFEDDPTEPTETLGIAVRLYGRRYLSWVWPVTFHGKQP
jgi:hypothetical protein